jgi:Xaa-Pro aminopeptidase
VVSARDADRSAGAAVEQAETLTRARLEERWRWIAQGVSRERLDVLLVAGRGVIGQFGYLMYSCGYAPLLRSGFAVFTAERLEPTLFVPSSGDVERVLSDGLLDDVRSSGEADHGGTGISVAACAAREAGAVRPRRVGVAGLRQLVSVADHDSIAAALGGVEIVDAGDLLSRLKSRKSRWEIAAIRRSLAIGFRAYEVAPSLLRPGVRAQEVVAELERIVRAAGARETLVFVDSKPHLNWRTTTTTLQAGDLVTVLVESADEFGYWVEQGGVFSIGAPSHDAAAVARACYRTLDLAESAARPGTTAREVASLLDEVAADERMEPGIVLGHGVGVDHDPPTLHRTDLSRLEVGNVLSLHPHLRLTSAVGGAVADVLYVGEEATESLARLPRALTVVE